MYNSHSIPLIFEVIISPFFPFQLHTHLPQHNFNKKGSCIAPDVCTCRDGYSGFDCKTPLCRYRQTDGKVVGCLNGGICQEKDDCQCIQSESVLWKRYANVDRGVTGWSGKSCSRPICVQGYYDPSCTGEHAIGGEGCYRCFNGGVCIGPDKCECSKGWTYVYIRT